MGIIKLTFIAFEKNECTTNFSINQKQISIRIFLNAWCQEYFKVYININKMRSFSNKFEHHV